MSIGFIIEFIMKLSSLVTLISFIVFRNWLGFENPFNGLLDEIWEGGRVLTQEWCYLDRVWMVKTFFEPN